MVVTLIGFYVSIITIIFCFMVTFIWTLNSYIFTRLLIVWVCKSKKFKYQLYMVWKLCCNPWIQVIVGFLPIILLVKSVLKGKRDYNVNNSQHLHTFRNTLIQLSCFVDEILRIMLTEFKLSYFFGNHKF